MRSIRFALCALLIAPIPAAAQSFGGSAAVAGEDVLFAQPGTDAEPGTVFVYRGADGEWSEAASLQASDGIPGDRFGASLDVDGNRLVVGAFWADSGQGAAYVFERGADGAWSETARLTPADVADGDSVGIAVAIAGDRALVAAPGDSGAGAVHVFRRSGSGQWEAAGELVPSGDITPSALYGRTIDLTADAAFVGAAANDSTAGSVWVFPVEAGAFAPPTRIEGPAPRSRFGSTLLADGNALFVGAPRVNRFTGTVLVYERDGDGWSETARLTPPDSTPRIFFGSSLARSGDALWVGAPAADNFQGAVYAFRANDAGTWGEGSRVTVDGLEIRDVFGGAIGLGEGLGAAGIPGDDYGAGTGEIFVRDEGGTWSPAARVASEIEAFPPVVGAPVACEAGKAAVFSCGNVSLVAFLPTGRIGGARGVELNDVWGWTDPETGKEYALVGRVDGTSFLDVTDPANPVYLGDLPKTQGSPGSTWRDIKVYKDHAFIVADNAGEHGMQVFDLTRLREPGSSSRTFTADVRYDRIHSAHNIVIDIESGFAYAVGAGDGGETCGGGLHMIDISDPLNPTFAGCFADPSTGRQGTGYTHDAQCVVYRGPDVDHQGSQICFGANETALSIADVTDKENPTAIAMVEYPNVGYTHQAWLTEDHRYLLMNDELDEMQGLVDNTRTLIWDVSDLDDPVLMKEHFNPTTTSIDHNLYVKGDTVFQSNYVTGLRVLDISDIENPVEVGYFDTVPYGSDGPRFDGSWSNYPFFESGTIVVTSGDEGVFLLRYEPAEDRPIS